MHIMTNKICIVRILPILPLLFVLAVTAFADSQPANASTKREQSSLRI